MQYQPWKKCKTLSIISVMLTWSSIPLQALGHAPGEEYTYLNMFRKNSAPRRSDQYESISFANAEIGVRSNTRVARKQNRRSLHSVAGNFQDDFMFDLAREYVQDKDDLLDGAKVALKYPRGARRKLASESSSETDESNNTEDGIDPEENEESSDNSNGKKGAPNTTTELSNNSDEENEDNLVVEDITSTKKISVKPVTVKGIDDKDDDFVDADKENTDTKERPDKSKAVPLKVAGKKQIAFDGVGATVDGEDIKRVSFMLFRLLKQYKAQSMVDVPCRAHGTWMHKLLEHVEAEIPDFQYYCVDTSTDILQAIKQRVGGKCRAKFVFRKFWSEKLPRADFVFSWSGLDKMQKDNVAAFLKKLHNSDRHKYVLLGSYQKGSKVQKKKATLLNLRAKPFNLGKPLRVVSKLSIAPVRKQMYVYEASQMQEE